MSLGFFLPVPYGRNFISDYTDIFNFKYVGAFILYEQNSGLMGESLIYTALYLPI